MKEEDRQHAIRLRLARMAERETAPPLSTGFPSLDQAIGGGWPRGALVELFGPASSGKTTLALRSAAYAQSSGGAAAWIDAEHSFDPAYAAQLGVDIGKMPVVQPESAEQALEIVRQLSASGAVDLVFVDSAAALVSALELQSALGSGQSLSSRALASGLRHLGRSVSKADATVVFLNQVRSRPEPAGGESETTAGGPSLRLYAAVRIALEAPVDGPVSFRVLKNRLSEPFATGAIELP